ncbi:MAG: class I SAM-dependent RNA methyltransferase [Clostridiales bacterium]|nr:class I SAM-dependent RNA methyltransferase [Clostridiales bacterium]
MKIVLTSLFGLESCVREDLTAIGYERSKISVSDGMVVLDADDDTWELDVARVNMWTRRAERVLFEVGSFPASEFSELFDKTCCLCWDDFIPEGYAFIVNGYSRKSNLYGISACQSLVKKAVVKSLCLSRGLGADGIIAEDPAKGVVRIQFGIVNDVVSLMIDTSGDGLHKRGYRPLTHEAPIRETLASGMITLSRYKPFGVEALADPFCGSGTILIEAAMMACNIAPGKNRHFSYESLPYIGEYARLKAYEEAISLEDTDSLDDCFYFGSDIDPKAIESSINNAKAAGVSRFIHFNVADAATRTPASFERITGFNRTMVVTNPPYGGRLMTPEEAEEIYRMISSLYLTSDGFCRPGMRLSVISPDDTFEVATGHKADKRFKLYNGNIKCQLNNYFKLKK